MLSLSEPALSLILITAQQSPLWLEILLMAGVLVAFGVAAGFISKGTEKLEALAGQGMAGGVILGLMAALPETIFVVIAVIHGAYPVAIGTALGGNVILFTLGIGLVAVAYFGRWKKEIVMKEDYQVDVMFLMLSTVALLVLLLYGKLDLVTGVLLFAIYGVYVVYRYSQSHSRIMQHMRTETGRKEFLEAAMLMAVGMAIVVLFSNLFIDTIINVAGILGIGAVWLALVITPIASDFEEQLSAYRLARGSVGGGSTAIVSFIGGKLENNTVLLGVIGIFAAAPVYIASTAPEFIAVIIINVIAIGFLARGRFAHRQGLFMIALYFVTIAAAFIV